MIKFIRAICINLFILSLAFYIGVSIYNIYNTDTVPPRITMSEDEITISVQDEENEIFTGITASDDKDGDVTRYLTLENLSNFISPGTRTATIAVFDNAGNVARTTRTIHYSDYVSPEVILTAPLRAPLNDITALLDNIRINDCLEGDITDNLQIVSEKTLSAISAGTYQMNLQVSNNAGDTLDMPVTVELYNTADKNSTQVIELTDYLIYVDKGADLDPTSYLKSLKLYTDTYLWDSGKQAFVVDQPLSDDDNNSSEYEIPSIGLDEIDIDNPVDTSVPGTYEIQYCFQNYDAIRDTSIRLIVVVEEE
ncbi:MAG: hypothetical protein ACI35P_16835 [Bacillus sp. (in: firmicutes)]